MQLHRHSQQIQDAGATLALIGNGAPQFIEGFRDRTGFTGAIYTDPERRLYQALDLKAGVLSSVDPRTVARAVRAYRQGFRQTQAQGSVWQQGGVFVVAGTGAVKFAHRSRFAGDHPAIADIISAIGAGDRVTLAG